MHPTLVDLETLARRAGEILRAGYEREHEVKYKSEIDLVTEVDHQSEAFLIGELQRLFPNHQIVSEEIGLVPGSEEHQWFLDPLDGTVNFAHGIPFFAVSIAYARSGTVVLGAVYDPMRDEMFIAEKGGGARCNGRILQVSGVSELRRSLLATGFPYSTWSSPKNNLDNFGRFARMTQGVRRLGSAALDMCYVAAGRLEGYWELSISPWDVAAGGLIASEAGAVVTGIHGEPEYLLPPCSLIVAPAPIHTQMLEILSQP